MSTKNTLIAVITAAATGAAIALLLAPASGKKTRKKLMKEAESVKDTVTYRLMQAEEEVRHLRDKLGKKGAAAAEKANA
ncbi:MAG: YtxH domain-containing protein [Flavobacteriales bacterium]|nr:YtxH domain-containing protein [Flavobacteriales bacterium]